MSDEKTPRPRMSLALTLGRVAANVSQKKLAELSGTPDLSSLEKKREPDRARLEKLFACMDRGPEEVDLALFCADLLRRPGSAAGPSPLSPVEPTEEEVRTLRTAAALQATAVFHATFEQLAQALREHKARIDREAAEAPFKDLMRRPSRERWRMVEEYEAYRTWALCERAAFQSVKLAAHDADEAVDLARMSVRMAEMTPGSKEWISRVGGLCWGFLANARRVKGDFPASDTAFLQSDRLWKVGAIADPGLLSDYLRRAQHCPELRFEP